ncbi:MAG: SDR family oxidoreductase [Oscillospiraceae bacterium]|nr:SDR family oxidoreductase [Oscillospiraceae bacterium]
MKNLRELYDLTGKVAIVTGGRGLYGASISTGLCEMGATVVIASRNVEKCEELASELRAQGYSACGMALDLSSDESIKALAKNVAEKYGKIDILVNNAVDRRNLTGMSVATREKLTASAETNLNGQLLLSQAVLEYMLPAHSGSIINISSMRGLDCPHFPFYPEGFGEQAVNYTTEKWAMIGMTKYMAGRYGKDGIRVNAVAPGGFTTMGKNPTPAQAQFLKNYEEHCPLGRFANDDDIKGPVAFLASDAAAYITGATLVMDGGWTIW